MSSNSAPPKKPLIPRPSASLVVINAHNEVLLVQRNPKTRFFAGVSVFPGGNTDKGQDSSYQMTAIRETFEESGLLLASSASGQPQLSDEVLDTARAEIHGQKTQFQDFLAKYQLSADVSSLLPFTEWITPPTAPRRFHTRFYVAFLPSASSSGFSSGNKHDRLPKPDGGQEVITARFIHPTDALTEFKDGKITFMPPQFYILQTLSTILGAPGQENTAAERQAVTKLAHGAFGRMTINPRSMGPPDSEGIVTLTYEGDETRGGSKGRLHRIKVKMAPGGQATTYIVLSRNFDIFSEIEENVFQGAKL